MKKSIVLLLTFGCAQAHDCCQDTCSSIFIPRSTGDNLVTQALYHSYQDTDCCYATLNAYYRLQKSFRPCNIAHSLFGGNMVRLQGSTVKASEDGVTEALIADNFGLSPDTDSAIVFAPRITNSIVDIQLYVGLDTCYEGLFFQINVPVTRTTWLLRARDGLQDLAFPNHNCCCGPKLTVCQSGCSPDLPAPAQTPFNAGCMGNFEGQTPSGLPPSEPAAITLEQALSGDFLFGDMLTPWTAGRFNFTDDCITQDTALASVNMMLGWNALQCQDYHLGIFLRAAAPTGTNERCCVTANVFQPHIGDNHWKLGAGLTGHYELYSCNDSYTITMYFEGYAEHLFSRCQARSFDFAGKGCLSRYMLLKEFDADDIYMSVLMNGINFATRTINTSIAVQGEGQLECVYSDNCGFYAGLGWNIYGRSREKGCTIGAPCDTTIADRRFGFKGCSSTQGWCIATDNGTITAPLTINSTQINSTQSDATIRSCGTVDNAVALTQNLTGETVCLDACSIKTGPLEVDALFSALDLGNNTVVVTPNGGSPVTENLALTSELDGQPAPEIIDPATAFDINSGLLGSYITNKIFAHFDYEWLDTCWSPKIYIGAEVEFANECRFQAMNAWGVYLGGSLHF